MHEHNILNVVCFIIYWFVYQKLILESSAYYKTEYVYFVSIRITA